MSATLRCALLLLFAGCVVGAAPSSTQDGRRVAVVGQRATTDSGGSGQRWALIVGVDRYQHPGVPRLHGAVADARAISEALVRYGDFSPSQVYVLTSDGPEMPTSAEIVNRFSDLKQRTKPGDLVLFFFAGHGVEVEGRRFLLTYEAQLSSPGALKTTSLPVAMLMQEVEQLPVSHRIIMVDACRTDPLVPGKAPNMATPLMEAAFILQPSSERGVRATFLSCSRGESAYEWSAKGRGFFSYFIERGLMGEAAVHAGKVSLNSLADYLNEAVPQNVRQECNRAQTPFSDVKGVAFTLVRAEKVAITPEHLRAALVTTRRVSGVVKDGNGVALTGIPVLLTWDPGASRGSSKAQASPEIRISTDEDGFFNAEVPALAVVSVSAETTGFQVMTAKAIPGESGRKIRLFLPRVASLPAEAPIAVAVERPPSVPVSTPETRPETPGTPTPTAVAAETTAPASPTTPAPAVAVSTLADQAQELSRVAYQNFLVEDFEDAERIAREALERDRENPLARTIVANCLAVRGVNRPSPEALAQARELGKELLADDPKNGLAHNAVGLAYIGASDLSNAEREFDAAITLDPKLALAEANLGYVRFKLGKLKDAEQSYRAAIRSRPEAAVPYNGLAQVLLARGQAGDAARAAKAAISRYELRDTYLAAFYVNLAVAYFQESKREQAIEAIARAKALGLEQNPAYEAIERKAPAGKGKR